MHTLAAACHSPRPSDAFFSVTISRALVRARPFHSRCPFSAPVAQTLCRRRNDPSAHCEALTHCLHLHGVPEFQKVLAFSAHWEVTRTIGHIESGVWIICFVLQVTFPRIVLFLLLFSPCPSSYQKPDFISLDLHFCNASMIADTAASLSLFPHHDISYTSWFA